MDRTSLIGLMVACLLAATGKAWSDEVFPVEVTVDPAVGIGPLRPIWRFFGADEPNYVYMKDGEALLGILGEMRPKEVFFRAHNLLTSGDKTPALKWGSTNVFTYDDKGQAVYDWEVVDRIFDTLLSTGVKPFVEIGFMPEALSRRPTPYRHQWRPGLPYDEIMTGWRYPPKDADAWADLVFNLADHCKTRYGEAEAASWYWETWNEANMHPGGYWGGTRDEFFELHDRAVTAVRRALPAARVGGPHSAGDGGDFTRAFLDHCLRGKNYATGETGTPLDFIAFHAKGAPTWQGDHVRMGISEQLATVDRGFGIVASFPELRRTPIVIGECDPEGCAACQGDRFGYRNGSVYSSYTAASFARLHELADKHDVHLEGALTWAFEFEDQPYFAGFRQLSSNGIPLPVLNVFRMFAKMGGDRVHSTSSSQVALESILERGVRDRPDVGCLASRDGDQVWVLLWHYHDDDAPGPDATVSLTVKGSEQRTVEAIWRVDRDNANAYASWLRMGSPVAPSRDQYNQLMEDSRLVESRAPTSGDGDADCVLTLPRQGVALLKIKTKPR